MACRACGDNVEEEFCYSCIETAEELGFDEQDLEDML